MNTNQKILIVGGVAGGASAAARQDVQMNRQHYYV